MFNHICDDVRGVENTKQLSWDQVCMLCCGHSFRANCIVSESLVYLGFVYHPIFRAKKQCFCIYLEYNHIVDWVLRWALLVVSLSSIFHPNI